MSKVHEGVLQSSRPESRSLGLLWIALFAALTSIGGMVRIPIPPVPFTLQTLFVFLSSDFLGSRRGALSQVLFLFLGLIGVPVFALGGGPGYVLQPTFGYLMAFPVAAWIIGFIIERQTKSGRWLKVLWANCAGSVIILLMGTIYLYMNMNLIVHKYFSWKTALWSGFVIFLPGGMIKAFVAAWFTSRFRPRMCSR